MILAQDENKKLENQNRFEFHNGLEYVSLSPTGCTVKVELSQKSMNIYNSVHGALMFAVIDCAAGETTRCYEDGNYVTLSTTVNFMRNVTEGTMYAKSELIKRGRQVSVLRVVVTNETDIVMADATVTMMKVNG